MANKCEFTDDGKQLIDDIKSKSELTGIKLSTGISYKKLSEDAWELTLTQEAIGLGGKPKNMQDNAAAFEGWALVLHTYLGVKIQLDVDADVLQKDETEKELDNRLKGGKGHFARFLYRALRFSEQYEWFLLSDEHRLASTVQTFKDWVYKHKGSLVGNASNGEAGVNDHLEIQIEAAFADKPEGREKLAELTKSEFIIDVDTIHRQLPVGLFLGAPSEKSQIFTGRKAAIDLWGLSRDRKALAIFELKAKNKMVGIVTELFFYANYMNDLMGGVFQPASESGQGGRGYSELKEAIGTIKQIRAYMLTDELHPLITDKLLEQMNENGNLKVKYGDLRYDYDYEVKLI